VDRPDPEQEGLSRRLYCAQLPGAGERVELGQEAAHHALVLRLAVGDALELFDGRGARVAVRIEALAKRNLSCVALGAPESVPRTGRIVLVQCMPRGHKLDEIMRMTTEIGLSSLRLAWSERCVPRKAKDRDEHKLERLLRIAVEAARQAEQAYLPDIVAPRPLSAVLAEAPPDAFKVALMERSAAPLPSVLPADEVWLVVGPEGGFSEQDRGQIGAAGFGSVSLGRSILRTETAAVVGVGLLSERLLRSGS
jgi:16S rRNA (uracil1498-N3)-methyltransferase